MNDNLEIKSTVTVLLVPVRDYRYPHSKIKLANKCEPSLVHVEGNLRAVIHPDIELELDGLILLVGRLVLALLLLVGHPEKKEHFL